MVDNLTLTPALPGGISLAREPRRNVPLLVFVCLSLAVTMSLAQDEIFEAGSPIYWLLLIPAAVLPLTQAGAVARTLFGPARWLLLMLLLSGAWHALKGDARASIQLGLLVWVMAWVSSDGARLRVRDLTRLYAALVVIGVAVYLLTDLNKWGPVPGLTIDEYGVWRVSFFPNIAYTALLSMAVVLVLSRDMSTLRQHPIVFLVALYFAIFSFVRTAAIGLAIYALLRWWFARGSSPGRLFWTAVLVGVGINAAIAGSVFVFDFLQQYPVFSRLFLRGESGLSTDEIYQQLYRPWLWWQQWQIFTSSPSLMGWGVYDFAEMRTDVLIEGHTDGDGVSLPTRLVAAYGLPGLLFTVYLIARMRTLARAGDAWACACFAPVFLLMMQWGTVFHPSDALFAIYVLMVTRGRAGFVDGGRGPSRPARSAPRDAIPSNASLSQSALRASPM